MFAAGLIGLFAGSFSDDTDSPQYKLKIAVYGAVSTLIIYGGILDPSYVLTYQSSITPSMIFASYLTGLPMNAIHAASTALFLWIGAVPIMKKIKRVKNRYGIV